MTRDQAIAMVLAAIGTRKTTAHGYTDPYGAQCLAFDAWYLEQLGYGSIMPGYNAIDVYSKNPLGLLKVMPNDAQPGDIHFMHSVFNGLDYGHTGVVVEVTARGVYSVDQNAVNYSLDNGSPAAKVFHQFSSLAGLLRPTFKGESDMVNDQDITDIYNAVLGVNPTPAEVASYRGQTLRQVFKSVYAFAIAQKRDYMTNRQVAATQDDIDASAKLAKIKEIVG